MFWDQESSDTKSTKVHASHIMEVDMINYTHDEYCVSCGRAKFTPGYAGDLSVLCPNEPEQHRIARVLGASDEFIESTLGTL